MNNGQAEIERLEAATAAFEKIITTEDDSVEVPNVGMTPSLKKRVDDKFSTRNLVDLGDSGDELTLNIEDGNVFITTLTEQLVNIAFNLEETDSITQSFSFQLVLIQDSSSDRNVIWPSNIRWTNGVPPTLSENDGETDLFMFLTYDSGVTWVVSSVNKYLKFDPADGVAGESILAIEPDSYFKAPLMKSTTWETTFSQPGSCMIVDNRYTTDDDEEFRRKEGFNIIGRFIKDNHISQVIFRTDNNRYLPVHNMMKRLPCIFTSDMNIWLTVELIDDVLNDLDKSYSFNISIDVNGDIKSLNILNYIDGTLTPRKAIIKLPLDSLYSGWSSELEGWEKIEPEDIKGVILNIPSPSYGNQVGENLIDVPHFDVSITDLWVENKNDGQAIEGYFGQWDGVNIDGVNTLDTGLSMCTSFDDVIVQSPAQLFENTLSLGYSNGLNHYIGISNYPNLLWDEDNRKFSINTDDPIDSSVLRWHADLMKRFNDAEIPIVFSISMELFYPYVMGTHDHILQRTMDFDVISSDTNSVTVDGEYEYTTTPNDFLGGMEFKGVFNPNNPYTNFIEFFNTETGSYDRREISSTVVNDGTTTIDYVGDSFISNKLRGKPGFTGYTPPSVFMSCTSTESRSLFSKLFRSVQQYFSDKNIAFHDITFQIGEPWWWDGVYQNNHLCVYDSDTIDHMTSMGYSSFDLGRYTYELDIEKLTPDELNMTAEISKLLGEFTQTPSVEIGQSIISNAKYSCLIFTPQVFNSDSRLLSKINFPVEYWKYNTGVWQGLHIEAYDKLIVGDYDFVNYYNYYVNAKLGFPKNKINYLIGFVPSYENALDGWNAIMKGVDGGFSIARNVFIWSISQINRDGYIFIMKDNSKVNG